MKAVRKVDHGFGHIVCENVPEPVLDSPKKVKIKIAYCGICGTDMAIYSGVETPIAPFPIPFTLGHEGTGTVVEVGADVVGLKEGDRVMIRPVTGYCGNCVHCFSGNPLKCIHHNTKVLGTDCDGLMTEYVCMEEASCFKLPDSIGLREGALIEPAGVAAHAVLDLVTLKPFHTVLVVGAGPIGLLTMMIAKSCGARVIVADLSTASYRLDLAKKLGADLTLEGDKCNLATEVRKYTHGDGVDHTFDVTCASPILEQAVMATKKGGSVVEIGLPDLQNGITIKNYIVGLLSETKLIGSYGTPGSMWPSIIEMVDRGHMDLKALASHDFAYEDCEKAFTLNDPTKMKVLLHP